MDTDMDNNKEDAMSAIARRTAQTVTTCLLLMLAGTGAAFAGPAPIEGRYQAPVPAPEQAGPSVLTELRWMTEGAAVTLAIAAIALVAVLWHRSHSPAHRLATH